MAIILNGLSKKNELLSSSACYEKRFLITWSFKEARLIVFILLKSQTWKQPKKDEVLIRTDGKCHS